MAEHVSDYKDIAQIEGPPSLMSNLAERRQRLKISEAEIKAQMDRTLAAAGHGKINPILKRKINALKKLQLESARLEAKFYKAVHSLECKYLKMCYPLYEKRAKIICEDGDEEEFSDASDSDEELDECIMRNVLSLPTGEKRAFFMEEPKSGVPGFWLSVLKSVDLISEMIQHCDHDVLMYLRDLRVTMSETAPMSFTLNFVFEPNPFFHNGVLTKEYFMTCEVNEDDPLLFDGPEIVRCVGCDIQWMPKMDVTKKVLRRTQKHKYENRSRTYLTHIVMPSFFHFFNPPTIADPKNPDPETMELLAADFEVGHYMKERIIPQAYWFFTGDALVKCDEEYEEEENDDDDEDDDEEKEDEKGEGVYKGKSDKKGAGDKEGDEGKGDPDKDLTKRMAKLA